MNAPHKMTKFIALLALLAATFQQVANADEASIKAAMSEKFPYQKLISVNKTPYFGLYEVVFADQLFYTDEKMQYLLSGYIFDLKNMANLTAAREKELYPVKFDTLPLQLAIKKTIGNGSRRLAVFSDPNCSYCKKLEREMTHLNDVTIYIFPVSNLPGSLERVKNIWCAQDRLGAWEQHMLHNSHTLSAKCNTQPLSEIAAAAKLLNIQVTPTLIFEDGYTNAGWMEVEPIEYQLRESSK